MRRVCSKKVRVISGDGSDCTALFWLIFFLVYVSPRLATESNYKVKIPDLEKSLSLVKTLQKKQEEGATTVARYNLADNVYGKAEVDCSSGIVNLWLGANVMLEYTYEEAVEFLAPKLEEAQKESKIVDDDLAVVRDQIVTSEVSMTRIFNWDVRKRRADKK
jgi:prefoldin subunit 5